MELNDLTVRRIYAAIGKDATLDLITYIDSKATGGSEVFDSPILIGSVQIGPGGGDQVGAFGASPVIQPAGADQVAAPPPTATPLTYVGVPDQALGDSGNPDENNRLACLAAQINNLISDTGAVRALTNRLRADLVDLGLIKGSS